MQVNVVSRCPCWHTEEQQQQQSDWNYINDVSWSFMNFQRCYIGWRLWRKLCRHLSEWRERLHTRIMFNLDLLKSYQLQTSAQLFNPIFNFLGAKVNSGCSDTAYPAEVAPSWHGKYSWRCNRLIWQSHRVIGHKCHMIEHKCAIVLLLGREVTRKDTYVNPTVTKNNIY